MTRGRKTGILSALLIIALGSGALMQTLEALRGTGWVWVVLLAFAGVAALVYMGLDKVSFVAGPLLIGSAVLTACCQAGWLLQSVAYPIFFILFGILLLLAFVLKLPTPEFLREQ